jgi:hypothetical protein
MVWLERNKRDEIFGAGLGRGVRCRTVVKDVKWWVWQVKFGRPVVVGLYGRVIFQSHNLALVMGVETGHGQKFWNNTGCLGSSGPWVSVGCHAMAPLAGLKGGWQDEAINFWQCGGSGA